MDIKGNLSVKRISKQDMFWISAIVVLLWAYPECHCRRTEERRIEYLNEQPAARVRVPPTPGCVFGERFYDLEETWHPELVQSGVLYCIICQCLPNIDKGILNSKGHVTCRDIKAECPIVACDDPVLLPEQCCKTCPGQELPVFRRFPSPWQLPQSHGESVSSRVSVVDTKRTQQDFIAILTGYSATGSVETSAVGVGYFSLFQGTLVYSLDILGIKKPRSLRITDIHGTVFHNIKLEGGKKNQMICGSINWPDVYIGFLRKGHLSVQIDTRSHKRGEISGEIRPRDSLSTETFTALLTSSKSIGSGALVSVEMGEKPNTIIFTATIMMAEYSQSDDPKPSLTFTLSSRKKSFHTKTIHPGNELSNLTVVKWSWDKIKRRTFRFLSAEKINVHLKLHTGEEFNGRLTTRKTCNNYWAILSSTGHNVDSIGAAGMVHIQLQRRGAIKYKAVISGIRNQISKITFKSSVYDNQAPFCELPGDALKYNRESLQYVGKGKCKKLSADTLSSLLQNQISISVVTDDVALQGNVHELLYNMNIREVSDNPVLLLGSTINPSTAQPVGQAWLTLSELCLLHYQVVVWGYEDTDDEQLQLMLQGDGGQSSEGVTLAHLTTNQVRGSEPELPDYMYTDLHQGRARIILTGANSTSTDITGPIRIKNRCSRQQARAKAVQSNKLPILDREAIQDAPAVASSAHLHCVDLGQTYQDGDTWPDNPGSCTMCTCKRGVVECQDVMCPKLTQCANPVQVEGDCCPQCKDMIDSSTTCSHLGDKRDHIRGTLWHPYVPPFGFMPCAVCQCSDKPGEVNCTRVQCPRLPCPEDKAILKSKTDCCKVCPENKKYHKKAFKPDTPILGDHDDTDACMFRGEKYYNGTSWHPNVQPFGVMKCVTCSCSKGNSTCIREKCPMLNCERRRRIILPADCCPICRRDVPRKGYAKFSRKKQFTRI